MQRSARGAAHKTYHQRHASDHTRADMPEQTPADNLRALPSVDALLRTPEALALRERVGAEHLTTLARAVTEGLRAELRARAEEPRDEASGDGARGAGGGGGEGRRGGA